MQRTCHLMKSSRWKNNKKEDKVEVVDSEEEEKWPKVEEEIENTEQKEDLVQEEVAALEAEVKASEAIR